MFAVIISKRLLEDLSFNLSDISSNGKISLNKAEKDSLLRLKIIFIILQVLISNVINSSDGQQVGGFACGYHAVMNCRTQREFFQSNYKNDSTPVYHKKLVQDELVQSLTQEHNNPDKDFYINLDKLYSKIKQEIELKAANSFLSIPNDLNINEGLKISLTGVIVGFIFAVLPWQFSAIISMLMLVIYLLKDDEEVSSLGISLDTTPETLDAEMRRQKCSMVDMQLSKDIVNTVNDDQHLNIMVIYLQKWLSKLFVSLTQKTFLGCLPNYDNIRMYYCFYCFIKYYNYIRLCKDYLNFIIYFLSYIFYYF